MIPLSGGPPPSPPLEGEGQFPFPPWGGRGPPPPFLGGGEGGSSQREEPVGAFMRERLGLGQVRPSRMSTPGTHRASYSHALACEWAVGCARGRRALAHTGVW